MNWGYFFAWVAVIFILFFVTGWPVTPYLSGRWGNHYDAKDLVYYAMLYFHYLIGALFFSFLILGLLRNIILENHKWEQTVVIFAGMVHVRGIHLWDSSGVQVFSG